MLLFGGVGDPARRHHTDAEQNQNNHRRRSKRSRRRQNVGEEIGGPERDAGVHQTEQQRRPDEPEMRNEEDRKGERRGERAEVVERQHVRDDVLEIEPVAQNPHQQRHLESDEHADDDDHA